MSRTSARFAKLTPPRLHAALQREQLFARLDEARDRVGAVYVEAPPGAGKTALAATWIETRRLRSLWYQIDTGDSDLPTFFHFLAEAAAPFRRRNHPPLASLTPEYLADVTGYARRFFRDLFARMPAGAVLVLDNCHEVPADHVLHSLVANAVSEVPRGQCIVMLSRSGPGTPLARPVANERLALVHADDLLLSLDEARQLARQRGALDHAEVSSLHALSAGWAAGFTLLLERARHAVDTPTPKDASDLQGIFDYFAGQILDGLPGDAQLLLLRMSFLPELSASDALHITDSDAAAKLLHDLHRRRLFTDRRSVGESVYEFHGLFREFLADRALHTFTEAEALAMAHKAGAILERTGRHEMAMRAYLRSGSFDAHRGIVLREAGRLVAEGRWQVVVDWIAALPGDRVAGDHELLACRGMALTVTATTDARRDLEAAYALATRAGDMDSALTIAAGVIETYVLEYAAFLPLDPWIDVVLAALARSPAFGSEATELRILSSLLIALAYRRPAGPQLAQCVRRVMELTAGTAPANLRLTACAYVVAYGTTTGPLMDAHDARATLEALLPDPDVSALNVAWASFILAHYYILTGDERRSRAASARVEHIGTELGLAPVHALALIIRAWLECELGRIDEARALVAALEPLVDRDRPYDLASLYSLRMLTAYLGGHPESALVEGRKAVELFDAAGSIMHRVLNRDLLASAALDLGHIEEAQQWLRELRQILAGVEPTWLSGRIRLHEALALLDAGDIEHGLHALREGFSDIRMHSTVPLLGFARPVMPRIAAHALAGGVDVPYVRELIRRHQWPAPQNAPAQWPWPVRVRTLGRFQVLRDDAALAFGHKVPRKPLQLLAAIIAMGGRDVREESLTDALWPSESADAAHESFGQALLRLRRLLGDPGTIQLAGGRISLDTATVWVDVHALDEMLSADDPMDIDPHRLLDLYAGDFLADETDQPWTASLRERLRGRFLRAVSAVGQRLERDTHWSEALDLYMRGVEADSLAESLYQGMMRCHAAQRLPSEAMSVYRRLRHQLSIVLGMAPSPSTEALARRITSGQ